MVMKFFLLILTGVSLISCGPEEDKDKQAAEFYASRLNTTKQEECNTQGKFYDNYNQPDTCDVRSLSTWNCDRDGLATRLTDVAGSEAILSGVDLKIANGMAFHQCGEANDDIAIIFIEKGMQDDYATMDIALVSFVILGGAVSTETTYPENLAKAKSVSLFGHTLRAEDSLYELSCNQYYSFWVTAAKPSCTAVTVDLGYGDPWTIQSADLSVNISAVQTGETLTINSTKYFCYNYSGEIFKATGEAIYSSHMILSSKVASKISDLDSTTVFGISFDSSNACQTFAP